MSKIFASDLDAIQRLEAIVCAARIACAAPLGVDPSELIGLPDDTPPPKPSNAKAPVPPSILNLVGSRKRPSRLRLPVAIPATNPALGGRYVIA
jgi:hypothetical protein